MILELFNLKGKVALVTGGNRGLGQGMAVALAEAGATVVVTSRSGEAEETLTKIRKTGQEGAALAADFPTVSADELVDTVVARYGRLDILVNNAGIQRRNPAFDFTNSDWHDVIDVNLNVIWKLCQAAALQMRKQGGGKIVNTASLLSFQGGITVPAYAAAKHGVMGLTKALANEWASQNINVNAIAPGYFATDMTMALQTDSVRNPQILERIPAGEWGKPEDLGGAVVYLASDASRYVHGHTLVVDGGWMNR